MRAAVGLLLCVACGRIGFDTTAPPEAGSIATSDAFDTSDALVNLTNANVMFVTSTTYVEGAFGSVDPGDQACMARAQAAGLPGTFVAWLSSSASDAKTRLGSARGWVRRDGLPVADTLADIVAGSFYYPPILDENGVVVGGVEVATGTKTDGTVDPSYDCTEYTSDAGNRRLLGGYAEAGTQQWTNHSVPVFCNMSYNLYCFENDRNFAIAKPAGTARKAFVSTGTMAATDGLGAADTLCKTEATAAGLPGSFVALIAGTGTIAASRLTIGVPWSRIDGAIVTSDFTEQLAALNVTATGTYEDDQYAWLGAPTPTTAGTDATTCANWTTTSSSYGGTIGLTGRAGSQGLFGAVGLCNTSGIVVYCFQQ